MSDSSSSHEHEHEHDGHDPMTFHAPLPPSISTASSATKRKQDQAGLAANGSRPQKAVKRRASKACQSCRARKVRCNVVEQIPCTNCRLDEVECIVSESKRKKKWSKEEDEFGSTALDSPTSVSADRRFSQGTVNIAKRPEHVPHSLYQDLNHTMIADSHRRHTFSNPTPVQIAPNRMNLAAPQDIYNNGLPLQRTYSPPAPSRQLPAYIKPLAARIGADEVIYLSKKGALTIPPLPLRNALLQCFIEFVHPYMPIVDIPDILHAIDSNDGGNQISLLVFQAIMFSGVASVDIKLLRAAGYVTRRDARRDFFQKTRLLYDFDYEVDRISLIQALLLMTYWYETPDDQKDSHHWMGIAVSLSHTIGLHRNPERSSMDTKRQKLWRRIWWSTYMRDRLIALGMRRPTRIKNEDYDVPMLALDDFNIGALSPSSCLPISCSVAYDPNKQRELAIMCVEKARLCLCISHVLSTQYSVLHNNHGIQSKEGSTRTTMMLVAKKDDREVCGVEECDEELQKWKDSIAPEAELVKVAGNHVSDIDKSVVVNRSLLHMVYYATLSALHRPQVLPSALWPPGSKANSLLELSGRNVRYAAAQITSIAEMLSRLDLVRFLPTVGITVLLPAIIIHLLDIKAPDENTRRASLQGFCQCMQIMSKLRDIYAAADYSTAFLEAAIHKAEIQLPKKAAEIKDSVMVPAAAHFSNVEGQKEHIDPSLTSRRHDHLTPPPENHHNSNPLHQQRISDADFAWRLNSFLHTDNTPPDSGHGENHHNDLHDHHHAHGDSLDDMDMFVGMKDFEPDFDALVNLDAAGEAFALDDEDFQTTMQKGEGGYMSSDVDWMKGIQSEGDKGGVEAA